ncbi:MAG: AAA family ATPase [Proteobacteria bacterium]|nr:AAA family ATPase [Pseudomonadota bacterium]
MLPRLCNLTKSNSFFLFGPRGSGKTTLIRSQFSDQQAVYVNLLDNSLMDQLLLDATRFIDIIDSPENRAKSVIIDEVQKLPQLLNIAHTQIQERKRQFILTGSSSRKLKQAGANLLAGRAWLYHLYPLNTAEMQDAFDLKKALEFGGLPDAFLSNSDDAREYLNAYVATYLQKEIQQEQWVKNLAPFRKFLAIAAQMNGKIVNKAAIAKQVGVDPTTVTNYFEILEDTLLGFMLPSFSRSVRKAQRQLPKFYFIDTGIKRGLDRTLTVELLPQTFAWGDAFEHWVILEFVKGCQYKRLDWTLSYLRTKDDVEIDLIVERPGDRELLVKIKSKSRVDAADAKSLETLGADINPKAERWLLSCDPLTRSFGKTTALYWRDALKRLFD